MPTYVYRCNECSELTEVEAKMGHAPKRIQCSACASRKTEKVVTQSPNMKRVLTALQPGKVASH